LGERPKNVGKNHRGGPLTCGSPKPPFPGGIKIPFPQKESPGRKPQKRGALNP